MEKNSPQMANKTITHPFLMSVSLVPRCAKHSGRSTSRQCGKLSRAATICRIVRSAVRLLAFHCKHFSKKKHADPGRNEMRITNCTRLIIVMFGLFLIAAYGQGGNTGKKEFTFKGK